MGFITADALGVPVEFMSRDHLKITKVIDMEEYGTHNQPKGTWSDDSSMVIATIDGLIKSNKIIDYQLIMKNFLNWKQNADYTPFNYVFDIGNATNDALYKYQININNNQPEKFICGSGKINTNGNGSLMRILPISIYLYLNNIDYNSHEYFEIIKTISSMTHSHIYSILGCYIYSIFIFELLSGNDKFKSYKKLQLFFSKVSFEGIDIYNRITKNDISKLSEKEIKSSGYVVDTLEAAIWCLLTTNSYEEAVLKAVNLGNDTDTIGAITGGLAGLAYGYEAIPKKWIENLQKKDYLEKLTTSFINKYINKK
ncbi:MAG: ADP-ribosylglycohydrolase family protein [Bacilli bacterium]|nr:ADP-ribosylglycohydrolase family protein [Bacilli bacterium]